MEIMEKCKLLSISTKPFKIISMLHFNFDLNIGETNYVNCKFDAELLFSFEA